MGHIAIVYSDTGGGHRTAALAIHEAIHSIAYRAHAVTLVNSTEYLPAPFDRSAAAYAATMRWARSLHRIGYAAFDGDLRRSMIGRWGMALDGRRAIAFVRSTQADVYVSCQPHFNPFVPLALRAIGSKARYAHVVTDLNRVHAFHFPPMADLVVVPNAEVHAQALRHGLGPDRVVLAGYPIGPGFVDCARTGPGARRALGLSDDLPVLLLMGGGDGLGRLHAISAALMRSTLRAQLIVVCGRNAALKDALDGVDATQPTRVLGFVDNVAELMAASDMLITKAGAGTLCEALAAGLPIIVYDSVPGQEEGNRDYVVERAAAVFRPTPEGVLGHAATLLNDAGAMAQARDAAASLARPDASRVIARAVLALLDRERGPRGG